MMNLKLFNQPKNNTTMNDLTDTSKLYDSEIRVALSMLDNFEVYPDDNEYRKSFKFTFGAFNEYKLHLSVVFFPDYPICKIDIWTLDLKKGDDLIETTPEQEQIIKDRFMELAQVYWGEDKLENDILI